LHSSKYGIFYIIHIYHVQTYNDGALLHTLVTCSKNLTEYYQIHSSSHILQ